VANASAALGGRENKVTLRTSLIHADRVYLAQTILGGTCDEGFYASIEVADSGCGLPRQAQTQAFEAGSGPRRRGQGIGLPEVLAIVRAHEGTMKLYSEVGQGTRLRLFFPCAAEGELPAGGRGVEQAGEGGVILVVDDEEIVRAVTKQVLEEMGFSVLTAEDGVRGLEVFRAHSHEIDVVLLDVTMPQMDGEQTFCAIREIRSDAVIVLSSGYEEQEATRRFANQRVDAFLQKPYRAQDLISKIVDVLR